MPPGLTNSESLSAPDFKDWSVAAVRLLQGVVYAEDPRAWDILLRSRSQLEGYFARIGLALIVDETEGYSYVRQWTEEECPEGYEQLPKLVRRVPLAYQPTLLAVLLRDRLRRHEEEQVNDERCLFEFDDLFEDWKAFFPSRTDDVKQRRELTAAFNKLADLGFVSQFSNEPEQWEVRKILKARLPAAELENLLSQLIEASNRNGGNDDNSNSAGGI